MPTQQDAVVTENVALYLAAVVGCGVAAQWLAWRLRIPGILLLLVAGVAMGFFVDDADSVLGPEIVQPLVSLSVAVVLFEGGLCLELSELKETRSSVARLILLGAMITWILATACGMLVFSDLRIAALAGAIFTVTGPTVVGPLLRAIRPEGQVAPVAKWEGIVIDPVGALLAVFVFEGALAGGSGSAITVAASSLLRTLLVSIPLAVAAAGLFVLVLRRRWIPDHLEVPLMFALVLVVHTLSNAVQDEAGLATVTLLGVILANQKFVNVRHVAEFKEHLTVLLISTLFILLGSRVQLSEIASLGLPGALFLVLMILVVRPISVFGALWGTPLKMRERAFLAWLAPRGIVAAAVASVFALHGSEYVHSHGLSETVAADLERLVPITFLLVIGTVTVYGLTAGHVARLLGIAGPEPQGIMILGANPVTIPFAEAIRDAGFEVLLVDTNRDSVRAARMLGLRTRSGNALLESTKERLDLRGIGRLLAMTPNADVNMLATIEYADVFGRNDVYRLAGAEEQDNGDSTPRQRSLLFDGRSTYESVEQRIREGAVFKQTKITSEFGMRAFRERYGSAATPVLVVQSGDTLVVHTQGRSEPVPGDAVIALVDPESPSVPNSPATDPE